MSLDTTTAWAKIKDFLSNFRHDCEEEIKHLEAEFGLAPKAVEPAVAAPVETSTEAPVVPTSEAPAEPVASEPAPEAPAAS